MLYHCATTAPYTKLLITRGTSIDQSRPIENSTDKSPRPKKIETTPRRRKKSCFFSTGLVSIDENFTVTTTATTAMTPMIACSSRRMLIYKSASQTAAETRSRPMMEVMEGCHASQGGWLHNQLCRSIRFGDEAQYNKNVPRSIPVLRNKGSAADWSKVQFIE